ncbi:D-glucuronyl C5-epimerase family protein [Glycomyces sp. NPDC048151]|uniref:D-glucuronyl C5-epimerase family protein n=1 Tax=Glycomyces sp. NPDC048151 TaxID=3364002 RepID=UPI003719F6E7
MSEPLAKHVVLHVGLPETGAALLQEAVGGARDRLREHGVSLPGSEGDHREAASGGAGTGPEHAAAWGALVAAVARDRGRVQFISSERFSHARADDAKRIVDALGGDRVRVVVTLRPLVELLSDYWKRAVLSGETDPYQDWLERVLAAPPEGEHQDRYRIQLWHRRFIERWVDAAGRGHVTVVPVDLRRPELLLNRFADLLGVPADLLRSPERVGNPLSAAETELLRLSHQRLDGFGPGQELAKRLLTESAVGITREATGGRPAPTDISTPAWARERAASMDADLMAWLPDADVRLLGDAAPMQDEVPGQEAVLAPLDPAAAAEVVTGVLRAALDLRERELEDAWREATGVKRRAAERARRQSLELAAERRRADEAERRLTELAAAPSAEQLPTRRLLRLTGGRIAKRLLPVRRSPVPQSAAPRPNARPKVPDMPPFEGHFAEMAAGFYRLEWNDSGYPCRRQENGKLYEHPIYPVYAIKHYLRQVRPENADEILRAVAVVADAAVERMEEFEGALVRWYEAGGGARLYERHYSALTQGYYAEQLWAAAEATGQEHLKEAARRCFKALTVPREQGGVLYRDVHGVSIAEVPQAPNSYILNGWQSALYAAWQYYERSGDPAARDLVLESTRTMAAMLPDFDAPEVANSRYGLTGFAYLRTVGADLGGVTVTVPGEGEFGLTEHRSRWANHRTGPRQVNLLFSLASREDNTVHLDVDRPAAVELHLGRYDPLAAAPVDCQWERIGTVTPEDGTLAIPRNLVERIVSPTNFVKKIAGVQTNVYHSVHVRRLRHLAEATGLPELDAWADRWTAAMHRWGGMPLYSGLGLSPIEPGRPSPVPVEEFGSA